MRYNGLVLFIDQAARHLGHPLIDKHRKAIILGSIREDVSYVPGTGRVFEHLSLSHFYKYPLPGGFLPLLWPGARYKATRYFSKAVAEHAAGREAAAFVQLGRAAHLVVDMACPVHVHRYIHDTDLFEWYIDTHRPELEALPLPAVEPCDGPAEVVERMSAFTARFAGDPTQHFFGRLLKKRGLLRGVSRETIVQQAREIVPMGCAYTAELLRLFLRRAGVL